MAVNLSPVAGAAAQFFDNSGNVLTGGKLYTYDAGTTTPAPTYTNSLGITAQPNPIILNAAGRVPDSGEIWLADSVSYKFVLKDQNDVLIGTYDNLVGINSNFVNFTGEEETQTATQGQTIFTLATLTYQPATNNLLVFVNGSKQILDTNFIETSSTAVTFIDGLNVGDVVDFCTATPINTSVVTAAQVSYNEGGTGAVTRTQESKNQDIVSVKDFGAIGDGVTDDTTTIQNAINYAFLNGGKGIYFPEGTYLVTPSLQLDGTYVALFVNDNNTALPGFNVPGIALIGDHNVWLKTTYTATPHTIIRWKSSQSELRNINFTGSASLTTALQLSRIRLDAAGIFARSDESAHNVFNNLIFNTVLNAITMENSVYYNEVRNVSCINVGQVLKLQLPAIFFSSGIGYQSGVNRNNFYNISGVACVNGIRIDCGDTNKFYSCSFESLSGIAVDVHNFNYTYPTVNETNYNTFYATTNEANALDLNYQGAANMNSFIDFEASTDKTVFATRPLIYIQSGTANNFQTFKDIVVTDDANVLIYGKNRTYLEKRTYSDSFADFKGLGTDNTLKGYDWRYFSITPAQCTNVATLSFNNNLGTALPLFKAMGGVIFYVAKIKFTVTNTSANVVLPVPYAGWQATYSYGGIIPMSFPLSYTANSGTLQVVSASFDGDVLTLTPPGGNWNSTSNELLINIFYVKYDITPNVDTN